MQIKYSDNEGVDLTIKKELGIASAEDIKELELLKMMHSMTPEYCERVWKREAQKVMQEKGINI